MGDGPAQRRCGISYDDVRPPGGGLRTGSRGAPRLGRVRVRFGRQVLYGSHGSLDSGNRGGGTVPLRALLRDGFGYPQRPPGSTALCLLCLGDSPHDVAGHMPAFPNLDLSNVCSLPVALKRLLPGSVRIRIARVFVAHHDRG